MFKSLESKLIGTYALIVALSLLVAGALTVAVLNTVQLNVAERYLSWQATNVARVVQFWLDQGRPLPELRRFLELQRAGAQQIFWLDADGKVIGHVRPPDELLSLEG